MTERSGTIGATLTGAHALLRGETPSPQLDAELLLAHVLKRARESLLAHREEPLPAAAARAYTSLVHRRVEGVPLAYLTGRTEFYGREFIVTPAVMIPRPESEAVVEETLRILDTRVHHCHPERSEGSRRDSSSPLAPQNDRKGPIVADIGTGSGVLAATIAAEAPRVRVVATDRSSAALTVARRNARKHKVARHITLIESDLLTEIPPELAPTMIIANLPYLPSDELKNAGATLETRGLLWEPKTALDGGPDGLFVLRRLFAQLRKLRTRNLELTTRLKHLILEHSPNQRRRILELAHDALHTLEPHEVTPFVTSWR